MKAQHAELHKSISALQGINAWRREAEEMEKVRCCACWGPCCAWEGSALRTPRMLLLLALTSVLLNTPALPLAARVRITSSLHPLPRPCRPAQAFSWAAVQEHVDAAARLAEALAPGGEAARRVDEAQQVGGRAGMIASHVQ